MTRHSQQSEPVLVEEEDEDEVMIRQLMIERPWWRTSETHALLNNSVFS